VVSVRTNRPGSGVGCSTHRGSGCFQRSGTGRLAGIGFRLARSFVSRRERFIWFKQAGGALDGFQRLGWRNTNFAGNICLSLLGLAVPLSSHQRAYRLSRSALHRFSFRPGPLSLCILGALAKLVCFASINLGNFEVMSSIEQRLAKIV
jgi:hypothetical protein